jgi:hypothetical protein
LPLADAIVIKLIVGELVRVRPELNADIYGVYGALGVADGTALGIMSFSKLDQVRGSLTLEA